MQKIRRRLIGAAIATATGAAILTPATAAFAATQACNTTNSRTVCTTGTMWTSTNNEIILRVYPAPRAPGGHTWCRVFDADNGQQVSDLVNSNQNSSSYRTMGGLYTRYYAICTQYGYDAYGRSSGGSISDH